MAVLESVDTPHANVGVARSEHDALIETRGLIVFGLAAFALGGTAVTVVIDKPVMTRGVWATLLSALVVLIVALVLRAHSHAVWLAMSVLTLPIVLWAVEGFPQDAWISIGIAYFEIVLLLIAMAGRRSGLAIAAVAVALVAVGSLSSPLSVVVDGIPRWIGWIIVPQLAVATVWLWWAWWDLVHSADRIDTDMARRRADFDQAQTDRERVEVWRRAASRTHETVLNDLRYVLRSRVLDRARLKSHLEATRLQDLDPDVPADLAALVHLIAADSSLGVQMATATVQGGAVVDPDQWRLVRSAVIEIIRNASRHGHARHVTLSTWSHDRTWFVVIDDDARTPESESPPGIGRSIVLDSALTDGGITADIEPGRATLSGVLRRVPADDPEPVAREGSRSILSSVMAATSIGGVLYWGVPLVTGGMSNITLAIIGIVAAVASAVVSLRAELLPSGWVLLLGSVCGVIPWLVATSTGPCLDLGMTVSLVFLSGYSLTAVLVWARHQWTWLIAAVWLAGLGMMVNGSLTSCTAPTFALATSGVIIIPAYLVVAAIGRATATERWRRSRDARERQVVARARAQAEADLALQLERRVERARDVLLDIADGREVDESLRSGLRCLDAGIRAAIQVDPVTAGTFTLVARDVTIRASDEGVPVIVRALRDSSDARPLPTAVISLLQRIVSASSSPTVQVMTDGRTDYLTVQTSMSAVADTDLRLDQPVDIEGVMIEAIPTDESADDGSPSRPECLVMVSREIVWGDEHRATDANLLLRS